MEKNNNKNTVLAIVLSLIVLLGWQYFYAGPKLEKERQVAERKAQVEASQKANTESTAKLDASGAPQPASSANIPGSSTNEFITEDREKAISSAKRIAFENDHIKGTINLTAGRLDDLQLKDHKVTIEKDSPLVTMLSPSNLENGYFAEFGFAAGANSGDVPGPTANWSIVSGGTLTNTSPIVLEWKNNKGLIFTRKIMLDENSLFTYEDKIQNNSNENVNVTPYGRVTRFGDPKVENFFVLHEGLIGYFGDDGLHEVDYSELRDDIKIKGSSEAGYGAGWIGLTDKYWGTAVIPGNHFKPRFIYSDKGRERFQADYLGDLLSLTAGSSTTITQRLFAGPKKEKVIDGYLTDDKILGFDKMIDWGWFYFITKPLAKLMNWLYGVFGNFGFAILATTIIIKALLFYFANLSYASMAKMKKVQPQMATIKERFGDDRQKQQQEMMALYKKEKINPAAGCWPMLIQIPVFFALYKVIFVNIEMRHAPFVGWIQDLSSPDPTSLFNLFGLLPFDVPSFLLIGVWPLIMGVTMFLQMQMNPTPTEPTQAMVMKWMPVVFTFMLATFPVGLVIYWAWNNTLSILQQSTIMKRHGVKIELFDNLKDMFAGLFGKKADTDEKSKS
ncbi:MAG: membrane protein insertase YidC [Rhizobiales bacterium]|nr:membrane protein insertase YidC [Hyphomicrobiales bacterium]